MNWDRIEGNWKQFKGQVKEQWGNLTDDDFNKQLVAVISSLGASRSATALPATRLIDRSILGSPATTPTGRARPCDAGAV
jgi:hypothetical protein